MCVRIYLSIYEKRQVVWLLLVLPVPNAGYKKIGFVSLLARASCVEKSGHFQSPTPSLDAGCAVVGL